MRKALALLVLLPSLLAAQVPHGNVTSSTWNKAIDVAFFVAGAFAVYYVVNPITGLLNSALTLLATDLTKGIIALLVPLLGTVAVVFAMWLLIYALMKK